MQKKYFLSCQAEINNIVRDIIALGKDNAVFVLSGELGSGKTTLTRHLVNEIDKSIKINSPTFLINKNYFLANKPYRIVHYDLYRLSKYQELLEIGFEEAIRDKNWVFIEWPEKIPELMTNIKQINKNKKIILIQIFHIDYKNKRKITLNYEK
jgi:tRNA threonylcarbamoyladenosine biosynthesis protein TsaE